MVLIKASLRTRTKINITANVRVRQLQILESITNSKTATSDSSIAANQKIWCHPLQLIATEAQCCLLPKLRQADTRLDNTSMFIPVSLRLGAPLYTPHNCMWNGCRFKWSRIKSAGRGARDTAINSRPIVKTTLCHQRKCDKAVTGPAWWSWRLNRTVNESWLSIVSSRVSRGRVPSPESSRESSVSNPSPTRN